MSVAVKQIPEPGSDQAEWPPLPPYRFTVEQYHRMIEADVLSENDRVELLDGWILPKMTHKPPHDVAVSLAQVELMPRMPAGWVLRIQSAVTTAESEPEPDAVVARGPARRYVRAHPRPRDIGLLVEVADATLGYDRGFKGRLYARNRIPVYWIINIRESRVEVCTEPRGGRAPAYRQRVDYGMKESVPLILDGREVGRIAVRDLLP
jgi:Uma2 family endonuclease